MSSSYDKRYGKRQQCRTHVPRHCMLSFCLCLCFVTHAPLPFPTYPSSTPTVCDPLNFVCCLWRKKMRLSILATCKNFISCAGDVAVQCIDPHSLTHTHTYISHTAEPPYPFPTPPPLIPWLVAVFAKRLFALRLPVLFRIRFTDNCITALNISLFAATASHAPFSSSSRLLAAFVRLAAEALVSHTL